MDRLISYAATVVLVAMLSGCSAATKTIMSKSQNERTDIFKEVTGTEPLPAGFAEVTIKANIKTHLEDYYIGESKESAHGKSQYPYLINIDGQAALWHVSGIKDSKPAYDEKGKTSKDSEARMGIKYILEKKLRLLSGTHKVWFALPEDDYSVEAEITLRDGEEAILEFKPIYRYKTQPIRIPTFLEEIDAYEVYLNGVKVN